MKKIYLFAAAAAMLTACSSEELANQEVAQQSAEAPVAFSIYTPRTVTRAGEAGELTTKHVGHKDLSGFGVFAYYTNGQKYAEANTFANFMYNQQVKGNGTGTLTDDPATWVAPTKWSYEPVKYWPNEYGNAATSDDVDRVSFFAYAPWTKVDPSTGVVEGATEDEKNIIAMTRNTATGDPIIKYVVDTDPSTSVDLLWGVAGADLTTTWGPAKAEVKKGNPFIDLLKPNDPVGTSGTYNDGKIKFNLRHALAKLNVQIDYIDDANTPAPQAGYNGQFDNGGTSEVIDKEETKIFIREIKIGGFSMKGALNLNNYVATPKFYSKTGLNANTEQPVPNWKAIDGVEDLVYEDGVTFKDGRRDGKEGAVDAAADGEKFIGLNPKLLQKEPYLVLNPAYPTKFDAADKNIGVTNVPVNLFGDGTDAADAPIYVIPNDKPIDIEIVYDVETINPKLASKLSDGIVPGLSTENKIFKKSYQIFNTGADETAKVTMQAGEFYTIKIHLGMTSVKVEAVVEPWIVGQSNGIAELPANQPQP